jgi:hypothetical protein
MMLSSFDTQFYNSLPSISDADSAFIDRETLFSRLAPIFSKEEYCGVYEVCLVHHHFDLKPGEKMVSHGLISLPMPSPSSEDKLIIPERWTAEGQPFEFRKINSEDERVPPPPASLLEEFKQCIGALKVPLGICLAGESLGDGQVYFETTDDPSARSHVLEIKNRAEVSRNFFETCWRPERNGSKSVMACCAVCNVFNHHNG